MKSSFARNKCVRIAVGDIGIERKLVVFPPIVTDIESAIADRYMQIGETVVSEKPAVFEMSVDLFAAHPIDQDFSVDQFHPFDLASPRQNNHIVNRS